MSEDTPAVNYLRALFDQLDLGVMVADDDARYIDVNARVCELLGRSREELVGRTVYDLVEPSQHASLRAQWSAFLRDGTQSGIFTATLPGGSTRELAFNARAHFLPSRHCSFLSPVAPKPDTAAGGPVTMCAWTKRIRQGERWVPLELYLAEAFGLEVTHGICPDAVKRFVPDFKGE